MKKNTPTPTSRYLAHTTGVRLGNKARRLVMQQQGFTMIEVLVALVIFAVGLLATAGLQLASLRATQFSNQLVVATSFTREYGEIMQLIPAATTSTHNVAANAGFSVDSNNLGAGAADSAKNCTGVDADCTPAEMVAAMRSDWALRVAAGLPGGRAVVCRDDTAADAEGNYEWTDCSGNGEMMRVKMGWHGKSIGKNNQDVSQDWATGDRPRMIVSVMGNLKDYAN